MRYYAGATVVVSHQPVGVVCIYGDEPREVSRRDERALLALARQAAGQLEQRRRDRRMLEPGLTDPLTGVANRRLLLDRLEMAIAERRRRGGEVGLVVCSVADSDRERPELVEGYLTHIAEQLRLATRQDDTVGRSAAHEFTVVLPDIAGLPELDAKVAHIGMAIGRSGSGPDGAGPRLTSSLVRDGESAASALRRS